MTVIRYNLEALPTTMMQQGRDYGVTNMQFTFVTTSRHQNLILMQLHNIYASFIDCFNFDCKQHSLIEQELLILSGHHEMSEQQIENQMSLSYATMDCYPHSSKYPPVYTSSLSY